jgi:hypothetical protein
LPYTCSLRPSRHVLGKTLPYPLPSQGYPRSSFPSPSLNGVSTARLPPSRPLSAFQGSCCASSLAGRSHLVKPHLSAWLASDSLGYSAFNASHSSRLLSECQAAILALRVYQALIVSPCTCAYSVCPLSHVSSLVGFRRVPRFGASLAVPLAYSVFNLAARASYHDVLQAVKRFSSFRASFLLYRTFPLVAGLK